MTDPNVLKAIRLISDAVYESIPDSETAPRRAALKMLDEADALLAAAAAAAAEKPAEAAPVDRCVARGCMASATHTDVRGHLSAPCCGGEKCCGVPYGWTRVPLAGEVAAAPTVAAVKFDAKGDALRADGQRAHPFRDGWEAETHGAAVCVTLCLRPGEDAGETVAKMLAPVGREP